MKNEDECTAVVLELMSLKSCSCKHLQFVVIKGQKRGSGIAQELECDLSKLDTSKLFKKSDVDIQTLEAVMKLGAKIKLKNIEKAVKHITDDKVLILESAVAACDPKLESDALTSLCTQSLSLNKPLLSSFLISQGAKPDCEIMIKAVDTKKPHEGLVSCLLSTPDGSACLLMHALVKSSLDLAQRCLEDGCRSIFGEVINLGDFLKSSKDFLCQNPNLLEKLLKMGVRPDGLSDSGRPIDIVLALPKDFQHRARLFCTLIENGADLAKTTYPRAQGTTVFHIATDMAIQLGE